MFLPLSNTDEYEFEIDDADYELVAPFRWRLMNTGYVVAGYVKGEHNTFKSLHRFIFGLPNGRVPEVDHIDRNPLNNTRANLRITDRSTNVLNCGDYGERILPKGVYMLNSGRYRAMLRLRGELVHLGVYDTVEEANAVRLAALEKAMKND